jgi:DNA (cytosine-5)-methyltransferase 1
MKRTLEESGYDVFAKVLNSRNFGVPQNRERIYIVAFRSDINSANFKFPAPTNSEKKIKDIIEEMPVSARYYLSEAYVDTLRRHRARHEAKGNADSATKSGIGTMLRMPSSAAVWAGNATLSLTIAEQI